jgi:NAD(P)-dependent dehydrogenase (short-subunit alcohol dehydrogenase family)
MQNFKNKVVVVTGAAGGIGRALAEAFLREGAKAVLADIEEESLLATRRDLQASAAEVEAVVTDVSKPDQVEHLAAEAYRLFGRVDVLCNNAGITYGGPATWESTLEDWQWVLGVNLMGAVHGLRSFVPRMLCQGEEGVIVNTSSILGLQFGNTNAAYPISKHGVVVLSESIYNEFSRRKIPISVHVLCPSFVATKILDSSRNSPSEKSRLGEAPLSAQADEYYRWFEQQHREGMPPKEVATMTLDAIRKGDFYIITHPRMKALVECRMKAILEGTPPTFESVRDKAASLGITPPPPYPDELL